MSVLNLGLPLACRWLTRCHNVAVRHNSTEADVRELLLVPRGQERPCPTQRPASNQNAGSGLAQSPDQGYGRFKAGGKTYLVSRYAWREKGKANPGALTVSARCENKLCVRHLYTRTRAEIMASVSRRWASGDLNHALPRDASQQMLRDRLRGPDRHRIPELPGTSASGIRPDRTPRGGRSESRRTPRPTIRAIHPGGNAVPSGVAPHHR
jgi:hypothetical protein